MSQSCFSIVLVGVSALLRRPLVSRLRPAGFTARGSGGFHRSALPSVSEIAARRVGLRAHGFRFSARTVSEIAARWVGLRTHGFRFSARTTSGLPLGGLAFGLTASAFRHAPLRGCRWASRRFRLPIRGLPLGELTFGLTASAFGTHRFGVALGELVLLPSASEIATRQVGASARRVGLRAHDFRFSACAASELPLGGLVLPPSVSEIATRRVGLRTHGFRFWHAPLRGCPRRVDLRVHGFRFSARTASGLPLGGLAFGLTASAFGTHRSAPPRRRSEGRRSTPTRHLFHFKTLIPTC